MATRASSRFGRLVVAIALASALLALALIGTLAVPLPTWRTGDQGLAPLRYAFAVPPTSPRIWIDTDAACGHSARTDPDDCLAIALLARTDRLHIAGISTVFGNADRNAVDTTVAALSAALVHDAGRPLALWPGAAQPGDPPAPMPAQAALMAALEAGPLTIVALGPLTNIAAVLRRRPDLVERVAALFAVMGRRPGHLFHPAEGAPARSFLGHGPVFRDFNFALDTEAARLVLDSRVPITLVPYDAARGIEVTAADVSALKGAGATGQWLAPRLDGWLGYWRAEVGREGFYPFDLVAAAAVAEPDTMHCAAVRMWIGEDDHAMLPGFRPTALLVVDAQATSTDAHPHRLGHYCAAPVPGLKRAAFARLVRG